MAWEFDDKMLEKLRTLWELAPPGAPVRELTEPLSKALVDAVGPADAKSQAAEVLGDVDGTYDAALALKVLAGEVDVLLHAVGIAAALQFVLGEGEKVISVSLDHDGGGTGGLGALCGDVVTDRQVAEFTFIRWDPVKSNGRREEKLLADLVKLDLIADDLCDGRRRVLYVTGQAPAKKFLNSGQNIIRKLKGKADVLERMQSRHGDRFQKVREYWQHAQTDNRIELIDLYDIAPQMKPPV